MTEQTRAPESCSKETYDLIIAGGGIYGVMLAYEAVRRNLRPLMLEKNDFTSATSLNHLRTVHGGLRYLQTLDLPRFKESINERKWFLKHFPQFVTPMACLMPLYGKGMHRPFILRLALLANDILSFNRNRGVREDRRLLNGRVISASRTADVFPMVDANGLKAGAVWYDGAIQEFQRLLMELIKVSAAKGARFLNYTRVTGLMKNENAVTGVTAKDTETGTEYQFNAPVVINAAGPWSRELAGQLDRDHAPLFKKRLLLWNVLFNKPALSGFALGLAPEKGSGRSYFFHPWKNRLLIGTGELTVEKSENETRVPPEEMQKFIDAVNDMAPGLDITTKDIQRVYSGILPARDDGALAKREEIFNHETQGGPKGLFSISGVKFTTSRLVADKTLNRIFPGREKISHQELIDNVQTLQFDYDWEPAKESDFDLLKEIIESESVVHLSDLILRRTSIGDHPERALRLLPKIKHLFSWDDRQWRQEEDALKRALNIDVINDYINE
jgi:glycerol-3-phosphate dehydrogenase